MFVQGVKDYKLYSYNLVNQGPAVTETIQPGSSGGFGNIFTGWCF